MKAGLFTEPAICKEALAEYKSESNPAATFLRELCTGDPNGQEATEVLYQSYVGWCKGNGFAVLNGPQFGKEVRKAYPKMRKGRTTSLDGSRPWVYQGLVLRAEVTMLAESVAA